MGTLCLVRHGQASFGADDHDQPSALGHRPAARLGQYWRDRRLPFGAVPTSTLRRHTHTFNGIAEGPQRGTATAVPAPLPLPGLNAYDSLALLRTLHSEPPLVPDSTPPERHRQDFRLLCDALAQWLAGVTGPQGMPS